MKFVIIGNGIAGLTSAETIRSLDKDSEIILIGDENYQTYSRPMMTKAPFRGFDTSKFMIKDENWYFENKIVNLLSKKAVSICTNKKTITLDDGQILDYDKCILATGAESFVPNIDGTDKEGVFVARKINDIENTRKYILKSKNAVVIGGGVIGLESAWELKKAGLNVVVLEQTKYLMERLLDSNCATVLENIIKSQGIKIVTNAKIKEICGDSKASKVSLEDGSSYDADIVVLSCGIKPNTEIAKTSGIEANKSIVVNSKMETNIEDIYACGDCAEFNNINLGLWEQAIKQAKVAGQNACGMNVEYTQIPSNLIFNGINTSLYVIGDVGKCENTKYEEIIIEKNQKESKYFLVNNPLTLGYSYEKYYFVNKKIVGGVLIGDLSNLNLLKTSIENNLSIDEFKSLLNN